MVAVLSSLFSIQNLDARTQYWLRFLLVGALVLHIFSALAVFTFRPEAISTTPDPLDYRLAALSFLDYKMFSFAPEAGVYELLRPPVYPFILAGTYLLDGRTGLLIILIQSILIVVMAFMLFKLLLAFRVPDTVALIAVGLYVIEPLQWLYTLHTMTETFTSFIILAAIVGAFAGQGINDWKRACLFGVGLALMILIKPSAMMWIPFLFLLIFCAPTTWRNSFLYAGIAGLFFVATLTPWVIRNYDLTGYPIVSSSGAYNFIYFAGTPETVPEEYYAVVKDVSYNNHSNVVHYAYTTEGYEMLLETRKAILENADYLSFITRQIVWAPVVWFGFVSTYNQETYGHGYGLIASFLLGESDARDEVLLKIDLFMWTVLLILTIIGALSMIKNPHTRWKILPLFGILFATIFINFNASWTRVLLPLYPIIVLFASVGTVFLLEKYSTYRTRFMKI